MANRMRFFFFLLITVTYIGYVSGETSAARNDEPAVKPPWTVGTHPGYLSPRYIQGVGLSNASKDPVQDRQAADQNAYAEVIRQITAEVSSDFSVEKLEVRGGKADTILERASSGTRIRSKLTVNGLTIVERFFNSQEKIFYSLAVLDRIAASEPYQQALNKQISDYQTYLKSAEEHRKQGKLFQSLLSLQEAYHAASQYQEVLPSFQLLVGQSNFKLEQLSHSAEPSPTAVLESLSGILSRLKLRVEKGNQQGYIINKPLRDPLEIRLTLETDRSIPAEGFSIEFHFRAGQGDIFPMTVKTGEQGQAVVTVTKIEPSPDEKYGITATVNFHELLDTSQYRGDWNSRIPVNPMTALFTLERKKAPPSTRVLVLISDNNNSKGNPALIRNILVSRLSQLGFRSAENTATNLAFSREEGLSWDVLRKRIPKNVGIVIMGEITDVSINSAMGVVVCNLNGLVKGMDVKSGKTLLTQSFEGIRGFGPIADQARDDAYKNAGSEMANVLIEDLLMQLNE